MLTRICYPFCTLRLPLELALRHSLVVGAPRYRTDIVLIPAARPIIDEFFSTVPG